MKKLFHHSIAVISKEMLLTILLGIFLFGKFYYFFYGWSAHLLPTATVYIILLKDVFFIFILLIFLKDIFSSNQKVYSMIYIIILVNLIISYFHAVHYVAMRDWIQFYLRNSFLYTMTIILVLNIIKNSRLIFNCIKFFAIINAILAIYSHFLMKETLFDNRAIGLTDNPNTLAAVLFAGVIIVILQMLKSFSVEHIIHISLLTSGIFVTQSITYIFMCLLFYLYIIVFNLKFTKIIIITLIALLVINYFYDNIMEANAIKRILHIISNFDTVNTTSSRINQYMNFFHNLSFTEFLIGDYQSGRYIKYDSSYLVILSNYGFIGLITYITPIIFLLKYFRTRLHNIEIEIIYVSIVLFLIASLGRNLFNRFPVNVIHHMYLGLMIKLYIYDRIIHRNTCIRSINE
jgi:hypothetical protein